MFGFVRVSPLVIFIVTKIMPNKREKRHNSYLFSFYLSDKEILIWNCHKFYIPLPELK